MMFMQSDQAFFVASTELMDIVIKLQSDCVAHLYM